MTAEIAILNRTAVALAADSIVTLSGPNTHKTYDSAEKIFELSRFQPIGLMIYNNAEFMSAPLEILVRKYRESVTAQFDRLLQVRPQFLKFLQEFDHDLDHEKGHFESLVSQEIGRVRVALENHVRRVVASGDVEGARKEVDVLLEACALRKAEAEQSPLENFLTEKSLEDFASEYGDVVVKLAQKKLSGILGGELPEELISALTELMFVVVKSTTRSPAYTGLVFAGFGKQDLFPTLDSIEFDGIYFRELRLLNGRTIDIDRRRGETAAIVPFAQKDMPQRFINGIDDDFELKLEKVVEDLVRQIIDQTGDTFSESVAEDVTASAIKQFNAGLTRLKRLSEYNLESVVNFLSKKELAEVAYSLVELTSRKRRYSSDMETVGGPIDVAILTLNEGFIWVRRKHYFDASLNPGYFERLRFERGRS